MLVFNALGQGKLPTEKSNTDNSNPDFRLTETATRTLGGLVLNVKRYVSFL